MQRHGQHRRPRRIAVADRIHGVAVHRKSGHPVGGARHLAPRAGRGVGQPGARRGVQRAVVQLAVKRKVEDAVRDDRDHPVRPARQQHERAVPRRHRNQRAAAPGQHQDVIPGRAAEPVQEGAAVLPPLRRRGVRSQVTKAVVDESGTVREPAHRAVRRPRHGLRGQAADGHVDDPQRAVLRPALRDTAHDMTSVRRRHIPVQMTVLVPRHLGRIKQHPLPSRLAYGQHRNRRPRIMAQAEHPRPGHRETSDRHAACRELPDPGQQLRPPRQSGQIPVRVCSLPGNPLTEVRAALLHPPVRVGQLHAENRVPHVLDPGCRLLSHPATSREFPDD